MPRKVTAWACAFGCGRKVNTKRKEVEKHELTCFHNPARRACVTCSHDYKDPHDFDGCYCDHPTEEGLRPYANGLMNCRADCPGWEAKN